MPEIYLNLILYVDLHTSLMEEEGKKIGLLHVYIKEQGHVGPQIMISVDL